MPFLQSGGIGIWLVAHTPRITAVNRFTTTLSPAFSNSVGIPQMPGAFPGFSRRIAFATSTSVGRSQQIVVTARLDSASFIKSCGMELC